MMNILLIIRKLSNLGALVWVRRVDIYNQQVRLIVWCTNPLPCN